MTLFQCAHRRRRRDAALRRRRRRAVRRGPDRRLRERLQSSDRPIGILPDDTWTEHRDHLAPGDRMLLFSDGLLDLLDGPGRVVARGRSPGGRARGAVRACCSPCASSPPSRSASTTSPPWRCTAGPRATGERRASLRHPHRSSLLTAILGVNYVAWRWLFSVNWDAWWIAVPLVLAETYSLIDSLLFGLTMWRLKERGEPRRRRSRT